MSSHYFKGAGSAPAHRVSECRSCWSNIRTGWAGRDPVPHLTHPLLGVVRHLPARLEPPGRAGLGPRAYDGVRVLGTGGLPFDDDVDGSIRALLQPRDRLGQPGRTPVVSVVR